MEEHPSDVPCIKIKDMLEHATEYKRKYKEVFILAEMDKDAVDFYRKNGFGITELFQNYGDETVVRYKCELVK